MARRAAPTDAPAAVDLTAASAAALELPALLALVAELTATDLGRERVLALCPWREACAVRRRQGLLEEASPLLAEGRLVPVLEEPLAPVLAGLAEGQPGIGGRELLALGRLLRTTREAADGIRRPEGERPLLSELISELPDLASLEREIRGILDRRGQVRDEATPALATLGRRVRKVRGELYGELQRLLGRYRDHLSEETIPLREGRLVLVLQAGARGRVRGLTHGRSATGKSFYFEPLEVVEANNELQQAVEDAQVERERILTELLAEVREVLPALEAHGRFLAELDLLQAAWAFGEACGGRLAEVAEGGELRLVGARHPLLDPRLAALRAAALGQQGHTGEIVPLELELSPAERILVVTGPNAGGKTVALKTVGLLALASQCGLPVPAAAGTRLPVFERLVATVGDEQDLLADRSTFSGRLLRLKEAWEAAAPGSLILLDELGSGTDPEEGSALAISLLEGLLERGAVALITTHLTQLAVAGLERQGASCAAMEFDGETGRPTYRLVPGAPGGSQALALARRLGLAAGWLDRAEALLGEEHRELRRLLAEAEALRRRLAEELAEAEREAGRAAEARRAAAAERDALEAERQALAGRLREEVEEFRRRVRGELGREAERIRREMEGGRRRRLAAEATERLFADAPGAPEPAPVAPPAVGAAVEHRRMGWRGVLERLDGDAAEVRVRGKRVRCAAAELVAAEGEEAPGPRAPAAAIEVPDPGSVPGELHLVGQRVEPALRRLDAFLDRALLANRGQVRVIHGHGSGRLRQAVREHLDGHPAVASQRPGGRREGGDGATVVVLKG